MSKQQSEIGILDRFSPVKFGKIVPTRKRKQDAFNSLRPNKGECLDYDISQTELKMNAGDTRINIKETKATYIPAPPIVPKKKKSKGKVPPYKFINEIWLEKQDRLQERYRQELARNLKNNKIRERNRGRYVHNLILAMVGPAWFQELSPKQLRTVDQLRHCILIDMRDKTITNVQENIKCLGLVYVPNHRYIAKALRLCCKSPVEFLLILYQVMNPKRKEYSLNDRLLLSAVVHLCMTETLREMHIRIPSPPVEKHVEEKKKKKKLKKKIEYSSPYLEPLTFVPQVQRNNGIYEHPRIHYPESPYFSYLESLEIDRIITEDIFELDLATFDQEEAELFEDMRRAQLMYDDLRKGERVKLIKPTIWDQCKDAYDFFQSLSKKRKSLTLPPLSTIEDSDEDTCSCTEAVEEDSDICCEHETVSCECQEPCECSKKSKMFTSSRCRGCLARERKKYVQRIIKGVSVTADDEVIPIVEGTVLLQTCDCLQKYQDNILAVKAKNNLKCQRATYIIGGVAMTKEGPVYILTTALKKSKKKILINPNLSENVVVEFRKLSEHTHEEANLKQLSEPSLEEKSKETGLKKSFHEDIRDIEETKDKDHSHCTCSLGKRYERSTNSENTEGTCGYDEDSAKEEMSCGCDTCTCKEKSRMYTGPRCKKCQQTERQKYIERIITGMKETASLKILPIIEGTRRLPSCDCLQKYAERILSMEARNKIQGQDAQFVVGGVAFTKDGPVYILSTALLSKRDSCKGICKRKRKRKRSRSVEKKPCPVEEESEEEDLKYSGCKCKQELEKFLNNRCTCEECNVRVRHAEGITYVMGGAVSNAEDTTVNLVQGIYEPRCDCLERYKEKIEKLEDYRLRIEAKYNLKSQTLKYSIGGVVSTPNGPIYVITGMRPPIDCECARVARKKEEEEQHLQQMAKMPPTGRIKYQIAGVRQSPDGNVFVISQALAIDDCDCDKLFDTYIQAHRACLDIYENFLQQTNEALEEYLSEIPQEQSQTDMAVSDITDYTPMEDWGHVGENDSQNSFSKYNLFEKGEVVRAIHTKCEGHKLNVCSQGDFVNISGESLLSQCTCHEIDNEEETESMSVSTVESITCGDPCYQDYQRTNTVVDEEQKPARVEQKIELKRFIILKKMPTKHRQQLCIVKQVLATMAEDGFPLAKLPDCHKLPQFRLWMQLRSGKFWRQKDINSYEGRSKKFWSYAEVCPIEYKLPSIGMSNEMASTMTWIHANYIKRILHRNVVAFYRQVGQSVVDRAREFFPISYSYEFPNRTFRDVFFAYLPSKENDTLAYRIVKPHETREFSKRYSCYN